MLLRVWKIYVFEQGGFSARDWTDRHEFTKAWKVNRHLTESSVMPFLHIWMWMEDGYGISSILPLLSVHHSHVAHKRSGQSEIVS